MALRPALATLTWIRTWSGGYGVEVEEGELDLLRFEALRREGIAAARDARWGDAAERLAAALALWRDTPLLDVPAATLRDRYVPRLEDARLQAVEWRIEAELHLGRPDLVVDELRKLVELHPLREHLATQLMQALWHSGRQAEALETYQRIRTRLVEELGIDPGRELRTLHQQILTDGGPPLSPLPRQLPDDAAAGDTWSAFSQALEALAVSDHVDLLVEAHRKLHDYLIETCLAAVADLSPGKDRVMLGTTTFLDRSRHSRTIRGLLSKAQTVPAVLAEVSRRNDQFSKLITPDFAAMGHRQSAQTAQLWVIMAAEVAKAELAADTEFPAMRGALAEYLTGSPR